MRDNNSMDRRMFARIPINLPIRFLPAQRDTECQGQTVDISANGVALTSQEELSPQTSLEMWLQLPGDRPPFYTRGEVVWSEPSEQAAGYTAGIRLERAELVDLAPVLWK